MEYPPKGKYFKSFWGISFLFGQIVLSLLCITSQLKKNNMVSTSHSPEVKTLLTAKARIAAIQKKFMDLNDYDMVAGLQSAINEIEAMIEELT
jgi:hypothetical protein